MLQVEFIITASLFIIYAVLSSKRPYMLELSLASILFWSIPLLFGFTVRPQTRSLIELHPAVYIVLWIPLLFIGITMTVQRFVFQEQESKYKVDSKEFKNSNSLGLYIGVGVLLLVILRDLSDVWGLTRILSKTEMNRMTTGIGSLFLMNALGAFTMAWAVLSRKYIPAILIFVIVLIQAVIFQSRSAFLLSVIAGILAYAFNIRHSYLRMKISLVGFGSMLFLLLTIFDKIKGRVFAGKWENIPSLTSHEFWVDNIFSRLEPHNAIFLLHRCITDKIEMDFDHIVNSLLQLLPMARSLFDVRFRQWGAIVLNELNLGLEYNIASFIWAELFSISGMAAVLLGALAWVVGIRLLEWLSTSRYIWLAAAAIGLAPYWCFFMFRVSLASTLAYIVNYMIIIAIVLVPSLYIKLIMIMYAQHRKFLNCHLINKNQKYFYKFG